jgi:hypothetical protein
MKDFGKWILWRVEQFELYYETVGKLNAPPIQVLRRTM